MMSDTFEQIRPKAIMYKSFNEAALAVDEMMAVLADATAVEEELDEVEVDAAQEGRRGEGEEEEGEESDVSHHFFGQTSMADRVTSRRSMVIRISKKSKKKNLVELILVQLPKKKKKNSIEN